MLYLHKKNQRRCNHTLSPCWLVKSWISHGRLFNFLQCRGVHSWPKFERFKDRARNSPVSCAAQIWPTMSQTHGCNHHLVVFAFRRKKCNSIFRIFSFTILFTIFLDNYLMISNGYLLIQIFSGKFPCIEVLRIPSLSACSWNCHFSWWVDQRGATPKADRNPQDRTSDRARGMATPRQKENLSLVTSQTKMYVNNVILPAQKTPASAPRVKDQQLH